MSYYDQSLGNARSAEGVWEKLSQVAVKGAEYNSPERQPHPKCLKGTRVDFLAYIYGSLDDAENRLVWINGTAGVGKSAVAFSVAERMRGLTMSEQKPGEKRLAGTFFFSRKYTNRCTTGYFFATLAYQLASNFPSIRDDLIAAIRENPALLDPQKSLRDQMEALFLRPLRRLQPRLQGCPPLVFIVDALDECTSETDMADLITLLGQALHERGLPVTHVLLTSRSEAHIREAIDDEDVRPLVHEIPVKTSEQGITSLISLDGTDVDSDIYIFLKHSFARLRGRYPTFPQPTEHDLARLASRAGRRFIVASTMINFIEDGRSDPRDQLTLMLELTSTLLPGTEVFKLYDLILLTCEDPMRAYLHLSVVAALANPLPMSQISRLLGPREGRDVERVLVQLRSVMDIPTDSGLPVNIYHSSIRDYVLDPSNCSFFDKQCTIPHPHTLLAYSSLRLMIEHIPASTSLLEMLLKLKTQSRAMESHAPQLLRDSLAFTIEPLTPSGVFMALLWLRGDRSPSLYSWLETLDGHAWLRTVGGIVWLESRGRLDWLQTQAGWAWLQTEHGKVWLQTPGAQAWLQSLDELAWLETEGGRDWLPTSAGQQWLETRIARKWLETESGKEWLKTQSAQIWLEERGGSAWLKTESRNEWLRSWCGRIWLQTQNGQEWLGTESVQEWLKTGNARVWLESRSGQEWLETSSGRKWLKTKGGQRWLETWSGHEWLETESGQEWLKIWSWKEWLQSRSGREWLQSRSGREWLHTESGGQWLQSWSAGEWLQTNGGREWLQSRNGQSWLQTKSAREWLETENGQRWGETWNGRKWLHNESMREWLQTRRGREWLHTESGGQWLRSRSAGVWLQTESAGVWLQTEVAREWLTTQVAREWLKTEVAQDWLKTEVARDWLGIKVVREWLRLDDDGNEWLKTRDGIEWLQTDGGRQWLHIKDGREWLQTDYGRRWLHLKGGREWLKIEDGKEWLQTEDGKEWLETDNDSEWLLSGDGMVWLFSEDGRVWLKTEDGRKWLRGGNGWLERDGGQWLISEDGREWLKTEDGMEWLQANGREWRRWWLSIDDGREWLQTEDGKAWLETDDGSEWLISEGGREWLQTMDGREWLQTMDGREWLQTAHGQAWQSTPAGSFLVHMEEFLGTVEAIREFIVISEFSSLPAFKTIQEFKNLPDFLMFPAFLALSPKGLNPTFLIPHDPDVESVTNEARERSRSASDTPVYYACYNWATHLSQAPNPWDNNLNCVFKIFWDHHLLSWLERQWCLHGLRSCLIVLSEAQKFAKACRP